MTSKKHIKKVVNNRISEIAQGLGILFLALAFLLLAVSNGRPSTNFYSLFGAFFVAIIDTILLIIAYILLSGETENDILSHNKLWSFHGE